MTRLNQQFKLRAKEAGSYRRLPALYGRGDGTTASPLSGNYVYVRIAGGAGASITHALDLTGLTLSDDDPIYVDVDNSARVQKLIVVGERDSP